MRFCQPEGKDQRHKTVPSLSANNYTKRQQKNGCGVNFNRGSKIRIKKNPGNGSATERISSKEVEIRLKQPARQRTKLELGTRSVIGV
jgi:hypothetical protein